MLIDGTPGFRCACTFDSMETALPELSKSPPEAVLLDIGLPGMSGIEGIRLLRERCPRSALLVLTIYDDDRRIFDALSAGACGYLLKKTPPARLLEGIREALHGGSPMSPDVARRVVGLLRKLGPPAGAPHDLTPHEVRIVKLLAEGHSYKTAGEELGVSINTVRSYIRNVYDKLQVHSKSQAVARVLHERLF
jgi:DNA-binding NarL/FixJ family response regulator